MRASLPMPWRTRSTSAPTISHRFAISFMNEMRVASIALAAYLVSSADGMSMKMIGLPGAHERRVQLAPSRCARSALDAEHDAVGLHEVVDRGALLQELGVRDDVNGCFACERDRRAHLPAVPTGTVLFVTTTSSRVMCRPIVSATASTCRRSAEPSSSGGVPTAMNTTLAAHRRRPTSVVKVSRPSLVALDQLLEPRLVDREHLALEASIFARRRRRR